MSITPIILLLFVFVGPALTYNDGQKFGRQRNPNYPCRGGCDHSVFCCPECARTARTRQYSRGCNNSEGFAMTMAEHAEAWWREQGRAVPVRDTNDWQRMYKQWINFAFAEFTE